MPVDTGKLRPFLNFLDARLPNKFWDRCYPCPMSGCWIWIGAYSLAGYDRGTRWADCWEHHYGTLGSTRAHRLAYETLVGPIPDGMIIDHLCRNRICVNPYHLDVCTNTDNLHRSPIVMKAEWFQWARPKHKVSKYDRDGAVCPRGHLLTPSNIVEVKGKNTGRCHECNLLRWRLRKHGLTLKQYDALPK